MGDTRRVKLPVIPAILAALAVGFDAPASASYTSLAPAPPTAVPAAALTASVETPTASNGAVLSWPRTPIGPRPYFGARYYASKIGRFTTVDPFYTWRENLVDPQRWNRYAYGRNNPLRYVDPDGRAIDVVADLGFIGYDVFDIGRSVYRGDGVSGTQLGALGADILGAAIPFATGGGAALRAAVKADAAAQLAKNKRVGAAFEDLVVAQKSAEQTDVVRRLTIRTDSGGRTQLDVAGRDAAGNVRLTEAKSSETARLTRAQRKNSQRLPRPVGR
jgi:RHS repeat-associated protein